LTLLTAPRLARDPIALYYIGVVELRREAWPDAAAAFDASLNAGATDPRPRVLRAFAWIRINREAQASASLAEWLAAEGIGDPHPFARRLIEYLRVGVPSPAVRTPAEDGIWSAVDAALSALTPVRAP